MFRPTTVPASFGAFNSEPPPPTVLIRVTDNARSLEAWVLVLRSKGLSPLLAWDDGAFRLHVPRAQAHAAQLELDGADAEEAEAQRAARADNARNAREARPPSRRAFAGGALVALLLLAFFAVTGPRAMGSAWFSAGAANAEQVLQGEWWRTVTALTLHADIVHVLSNVGIGTVVVSAVMRSEGVGWGAALVLASGAVGNFVNAWVHQSQHSSVGFSTAVFGAIGLLGGLAYAAARRRKVRARPPWTALAGSLALLAALGTGGERTDLLAHLFGGLAGLALGMTFGWSGFRPQTHAGQWVAGLCAMATVVCAWWTALA